MIRQYRQVTELRTINYQENSPPQIKQRSAFQGFSLNFDQFTLIARRNFPGQSLAAKSHHNLMECAGSCLKSTRAELRCESIEKVSGHQITFIGEIAPFECKTEEKNVYQERNLNLHLW